MKIRILMALLPLFVIFSCKKDNTDSETPDPVQGSEFVIPNSVGSYWVYESVKIDSNGTETPIGLNDSIYVAGDSIYNGKLYTVYKGTYSGSPDYIQLQRDSSGFIVGHLGNIIFSYSNFTDTLYSTSDTIWDMYAKMIDSSDPIVVPAGSFQAIERQEYFYNPDGESITSCGQTYFTFGTWYADGIGKVKGTYGYAGPIYACLGDHYERRLINYHIEE